MWQAGFYYSNNVLHSSDLRSHSADLHFQVNLPNHMIEVYKLISGKYDPSVLILLKYLLREVINTKYLRIALDLTLGNINFHLE